MDHRIVAIAVGVALVVVLGYLLVMRIFFRESQALDKKIDYSKMKEWKDDEEEDDWGRPPADRAASPPKPAQKE